MNRETLKPMLTATQRQLVKQLVEDEGESHAAAVAWVLAFAPDDVCDDNSPTEPYAVIP